MLASRNRSRWMGLLGLLALSWLGLSAAAADPAPAPTATAASVGLLPVHGVTVDLDALAGKGSGSPDDVVTAMQSLWDSHLKAGGFNVIGFDVDVHELGDRGAVRVARLCDWAKRNNVRIAPNLVGAAEGQSLPADYATASAAFVGKVVAELGAANAPSYAQILLYRLGRPLNHPASHGPMAANDAAARLKAAAEAIRAAEQAGLSASGLQASPLLVSVSLDYELVHRGAIVHTPLADETYAASVAALGDWLTDVLATAPVEAVSVEWFPGSVTSEGVERLPDVMTRLQADVPGKLLVMDTGFSSAAGADTAQARYYALALGNLCDLRARQGVESPFAGVLWRNAVDGGSGAKPMTPEQIAKLDWSERAKQLDRAWNDPRADAKDARNWLAGVQSSFGMLSRASSSGKGLAPKTALVVISRLEESLSQSPEASDALAAVKELVSAEKGTAGAKIKERLQSAMFGFLDAFLSKTAESLFAPPPAPAPLPMTPTATTPRPDVQLVGWGALPASGKVGTPITIPVTLFNAGSAPAGDAAVYLRTAQADLAQSSPTPLAPGATSTVNLTWTPTQATKVSGVALQVWCTNDADPQSNRTELGEVQVTPSSNPQPPFHNCWDVGGILSTQAVLETSTPPGGIKVVDLNVGAITNATMSSGSGGTWQVMGAPAPGGTIGGATGVPRSAPAPSSAGGATSGGATSGGTASRPITPASSSPPASDSPVTITLVNPFPSVFSDAAATLRVDGRAVSSKSLGTLLPRQQRSVTFTGWTPPKAGSYRVLVELEGAGPGGKRMTSTAASTVVVGDPRVVRAAPAPAPTLPVRSPLATRSMGPLARPGGPGAVRGFGTRPLGRPGSFGVRSAIAGGVLGLGAASIGVTPFPPAPDAPAQIAVTLSDPDGAGVSNVRVQVFAGAEDLGTVTVNVPATGQVSASGFRAWSPKPGRTDLRAVVVAGTRRGEAMRAVVVGAAGARPFGRPGFGVPTASASTLPEGGVRGLPAGGRPMPGAPASGGAKPGGAMPGGAMPGGALPGKFGGARPAPGVIGAAPGAPGAGASMAAPDLRVTPADIRLSPPSPAAGTNAVVSVAVRNLGGVPASGGQLTVVLTADGKEVARQQFALNVAPGTAQPVQWPVAIPAGALGVTASVTLPGDANPNNNHAALSGAAAPPAMTAPRVPGAFPGPGKTGNR